MATSQNENDDVFFIAREVARKEVERHRGQIIGITASAPIFKDQNGVLEWVCDVRVGVRENQGLIRDVLIAQTQVGIVNDLNIPVLMEVSESGRLTIVARTSIRLPDVSLRRFTFYELDFVFMCNLTEQSDGVYVDGFGYPAESPIGQIGESQSWSWLQNTITLDELGQEEPVDSVVAKWEMT